MRFPSFHPIIQRELLRHEVIKRFGGKRGPIKSCRGGDKNMAEKPREG